MIDGRIVPFLLWCLIDGGDWLFVVYFLGGQVLLVGPVLLLLQGIVVSSTVLFVCIFCIVLVYFLCYVSHKKCHLLGPYILHCTVLQPILRSGRLSLGQCGLLLL